jgi:predicted adenine nucleotide alpha hydrolase (AANH) superfamily ATPase
VSQVIVLDARGRQLSATSESKARRLVEVGKAVFVCQEPPTIQLGYQVQVPPRSAPQRAERPGEGRRILLHVCCAPCATYTVKRLRELGFDEVSGYWYNPNVHPFGEHELRRKTLAQYAEEIGLPVIWEPDYEIVGFLRAINGRERFRERCAVCYRIRLERTAQVAARGGFDAFTTTLLISPYQDQSAICVIGQEMSSAYHVEFYYENFRHGWAEHGQMAREHGLYSQRYCGCVYSEWEAQDRNAATLAIEE